MKYRMQAISYDPETGEDLGTSWWEEYSDDDPEDHAKSLVEFFNSTLRPGEKPRRLLQVEVLDEAHQEHDWQKRTDGMSIRFRGKTVDLMRCSRCGVTGKRFGLSTVVKIDSKYRKKAFQLCHTARQELGSPND